MDYVMKFPRPSPSIFAYCKQSKTGGVEGLGTRLGLTMKATPRTHLSGLIQVKCAWPGNEATGFTSYVN